MKVERRSFTDPESNYFYVEIAESLQEIALGSKVELIEGDDGH